VTPLKHAPRGRLTKTHTVSPSGHVVDKHYHDESGRTLLYRVERDLHSCAVFSREWFLLSGPSFGERPKRKPADHVGAVDE